MTEILKHREASVPSSEDPTLVRVASVYPTDKSPDAPFFLKKEDANKCWEGSISTDEATLRRFAFRYNSGVREYWARVTGWNIFPDRVHFVNGKNRTLVVIKRSS